MIRLLLILGAAVVIGLLFRRYSEMDVSAREMRAVSKTDDGVRELLQNNKKIAAIKLYREIHGVGLKEAKEAVEKMEHKD